MDFRAKICISVSWIVNSDVGLNAQNLDVLWNHSFVILISHCPLPVRVFLGVVNSEAWLSVVEVGVAPHVD